MTGRHDLWPSGDYDEFKRRLDSHTLVMYQNGRWWRMGFGDAELINEDVPFMISINGELIDATTRFKRIRVE